MRKWAVCNLHGEPITIVITNEDTGELEEMIFYTSPHIANTALKMMNLEDRQRHGARVQEVGDV